jgi:hypothetical protein
VGRGGYKEGEYGRNIMYSCMKIETQDLLKLFWEWGVERRIKENDGGVNSIMTHCKNFCKCHNVPPAQ